MISDLERGQLGNGLSLRPSELVEALPAPTPAKGTIPFRLSLVAVLGSGLALAAALPAERVKVGQYLTAVLVASTLAFSLAIVAAIRSRRLRGVLVAVLALLLSLAALVFGAAANLAPD